MSINEKAYRMIRELARAEARVDLQEADLRVLRRPVAEVVAAMGLKYPASAIEHGRYTVKFLIELAFSIVIVQRCACGRSITGHQWSRLPLVGIQPGDGTARFELRDCPDCKSTLARALPELPTIARPVRAA